MSRNEFLSEIFENLDADYEMLMGSGKYEHSCRPITAIFRCVISVYFSSFFIDHPVLLKAEVSFDPIFSEWK